MKKFEQRKCIVCGNTWTLESRSTGKSARCICNTCRNTLSEKERLFYYKRNEKRFIEENRTCINCGKTWSVFTKIDRIGHIKKHYFCTKCSKVLTNWEKKKIMLQKREGFSEKQYIEKRNSRIRNIQRYLLSRARQRALKYGLEFNLDINDIIIPEICPILEKPIIYGVKGNYEYSPSLDRIDNSKGYIKGNVRVISKRANTMKNSATIEELQTFCKNILRYSLNITEEECNEQQDKEPVG